MVITIEVPDGAKCLLKENQNINIGDSFYEQKTESLKTVAVAKKLNIDAGHIFHYLKKLVGEEIKKGDVLAEKKSLFTHAVVVSDVDGIIKEINHNLGEIILAASGHDKKIKKSYFTGYIKKIDNNKIKLEVKRGEEFPLKLASGNFGGPSLIIKKGLSDDIEGEVEGKVVIARELSPFLQTKAEALGVKGLITLNKLEEEPDVEVAQIKNIADAEKIQKLSFPYCTVNKKNSKMILYEV